MSDKDERRKMKNPTIGVLALMIPILALMIPITAISQTNALVIFVIIAIFMYKALKEAIRTKETIIQDGNSGELIKKQDEIINKLEERLNEIDKEMHLMREAIILNEKRITAPIKTLGDTEEKSDAKEVSLKKKLQI